MNVLIPPTQLPVSQQIKIFLAGSIEMGTAMEWQQQAIMLFDSVVPKEQQDRYLILNPRRPDWDSTWQQLKEHPQFYEQVSWELNSLQAADHVIVYFDPATKAPVSLLELGAFHHKAVVVCPDGYWRKGNVDIFCEMFQVKQVADLEAAVAEVVHRSKE